MQTGTERIAGKARQNSKLVFTSLAHHLRDDLLLANLKCIPIKSGIGVDKMSVEEARNTFKEWSQEVVCQVHRGSYKPAPVRRVLIPKPGQNGMRPIGVPTIIDRCLQKSVSDILSAIFEQDFLPHSFGGRPNLGAHHAISQLQRSISFTQCNFVFEADIKSFFTSLDHGWVLKFVKQRVGDPRILRLIKKWLKAGAIHNGKFEESLQGTPQGGSISVLISNIYLHYV